MFLLEEGVKKKNRGFNSKNIYHRRREWEKKKQQQQHPSWITSFLKLSSIEFQEVEKDNLQIKENMEK